MKNCLISEVDKIDKICCKKPGGHGNTMAHSLETSSVTNTTLDNINQNNENEQQKNHKIHRIQSTNITQEQNTTIQPRFDP